MLRFIADCAAIFWPIHSTDVHVHVFDWLLARLMYCTTDATVSNCCLCVFTADCCICHSRHHIYYHYCYLKCTGLSNGVVQMRPDTLPSPGRGLACHAWSGCRYFWVIWEAVCYSQLIVLILTNCCTAVESVQFASRILVYCKPLTGFVVNKWQRACVCSPSVYVIWIQRLVKLYDLLSHQMLAKRIAVQCGRCCSVVLAGFFFAAHDWLVLLTLCGTVRLLSLGIQWCSCQIVNRACK